MIKRRTFISKINLSEFPNSLGLQESIYDKVISKLYFSGNFELNYCFQSIFSAKRISRNFEFLPKFSIFTPFKHTFSVYVRVAFLLFNTLSLVISKSITNVLFMSSNYTNKM